MEAERIASCDGHHHDMAGMCIAFLFSSFQRVKAKKKKVTCDSYSLNGRVFSLRIFIGSSMLLSSFLCTICLSVDSSLFRRLATCSWLRNFHSLCSLGCVCLFFLEGVRCGKGCQRFCTISETRQPDCCLKFEAGQSSTIQKKKNARLPSLLFMVRPSRKQQQKFVLPLNRFLLIPSIPHTCLCVVIIAHHSRTCALSGNRRRCAS
jgi:hypothetical protein